VIGAEVPKKLMYQAGKFLSRRAHSRGELGQKLARYGEPGQIEAVLNRLEELKLLNDAEYAYNFALCRIRHEGWGPLKVLHSLQRRQVAPVVAEAAIERIRRETDERMLLGTYLQRYCRKKSLPQDRKGIQKLISHLRRRGFQDQTIFSTLRQNIPDAAWQRIDTGDLLANQQPD
jgi:regulatory protein